MTKKNENFVNDDLLDEELMNMPGLRVSDMTKDKSKPNVEKSTTKKERKAVMDAGYEVVKENNGWKNKLKISAKGALLFGGLGMLFFYWQQTGQMLQSASFPSIIVCTLLTGFWIGKGFSK